MPLEFWLLIQVFSVVKAVAIVALSAWVLVAPIRAIRKK